MALLHIETDQPGGLRLRGDVDLSTERELRDALQPMVASGGDLVVDLEAVDFMDGAGLLPLLQAAQGLQGRGHLVLKSPSRPVSRILGRVMVIAEGFRNVVIESDR